LIIIIEGKIFKYVNRKVREIKKEYNIKDRLFVRNYIYQFFGDCGFGSNSEIIKEYLTLKKLIRKENKSD
jgi:hypothetical protein